MTLSAPVVPAVAASTGGTSAPGGDATLPAAALGGTPPAAPLPAGPNTLTPSPGGAKVGALTLVRGALTPAQAGRTVGLQVFDPAHGWMPVGTAKAAAGGAFAVAWRPPHIGRFLLRALISGVNASSLAPGLTAPIEVFLPVVATVFGPGSYGSRTACGQTLTPQSIGVAHLSLPCGTMVDISYGNKTISVPVIDRGPYADGVAYDLTMATAAELGVSDTVRIGALVLRGRAPGAP